VSSVVKGPDGYYIVKVEQRRAARQKDLVDVRDEIETNLLFLKRQQTMNDYLAKLRAKAAVSVYAERLEQISVD